MRKTTRSFSLSFSWYLHAFDPVMSLALVVGPIIGLPLHATIYQVLLWVGRKRMLK